MNIYQDVTSKIIAALETAERWQKPWTSAFVAEGGTLARPFNAVTKRPYSGVNVMVLWSARRSSPVWATYKQWSSLGAQVRRGERGTMGIFWKQIDVDSDAEEGEETETRLIARAFTLFNAEQVDGYQAKPAPKTPIFDPIAAAETFVANTGAVVREGGDRACYIPNIDEIRMPSRGSFIGTKTRTAAEAFYSVLGHELVHWSGHASRCARDFSGRFGDSAYAAEELVAELGAAFLCADLGIASEPRTDHASYVASWLKVLRNDSRAIFTAASKAEAACRFLHGLQQSAAMAA